MVPNLSSLRNTNGFYNLPDPVVSKIRDYARECTANRTITVRWMAAELPNRHVEQERETIPIAIFYENHYLTTPGVDVERFKDSILRRYTALEDLGPNPGNIFWMADLPRYMLYVYDQSQRNMAIDDLFRIAKSVMNAAVEEQGVFISRITENENPRAVHGRELQFTVCMQTPPRPPDKSVRDSLERERASA